MTNGHSTSDVVDEERSPEVAAADEGGAETEVLHALGELRSEVAALADSLDQVVPHLVATLKRNQAFDSILSRLDAAEKQLAARREAPLAAVLLRTMNEIHRMDHLDRATRRALVQGVAASIRRSGYELLIPQLGDDVEAATCEVVSGDADGDQLTVASVEAIGLACLGDPIVRAKVSVGPPRPLDATDTDHSRETEAP